MLRCTTVKYDSVFFLRKTVKYSTFCHEAFKNGTFCCKTLEYFSEKMILGQLRIGESRASYVTLEVVKVGRYFLVISCLLITLIKCLKGHKSPGLLFNVKKQKCLCHSATQSVTQSFSQSVSQSPIELSVDS